MAEITLKMFQGAGASGIPQEYRQTDGLVLQMQKVPEEVAVTLERISGWIDITEPPNWLTEDPNDLVVGNHPFTWQAGTGWVSELNDTEYGGYALLVTDRYLQEFSAVRVTYNINPKAAYFYAIGRSQDESLYSTELYYSGTQEQYRGIYGINWYGMADRSETINFVFQTLIPAGWSIIITKIEVYLP